MNQSEPYTLPGDPDGDQAELDLEPGDGDADDAEREAPPLACTPGEVACYDAHTRWRCDEYGSGWGELEYCGENSDCEDGYCTQPLLCTPLEWSCYDARSRWRCDEYGQGHTNLLACAPSEQCLDGACVAGASCVPDSWICEGEAARRRCSAEGNAYLEPEACPPDSFCFDGVCHDEPVCTPGDSACYDDSTRWRCNETGTGFGEMEQCPLRQVCLAGECVPDEICTPNEWACYDDASRWRCSEDGTHYNDLTPCGPGRYCEAGACFDNPVDGDDDQSPDGDIDGDADPDPEIEDEIPVDGDTDDDRPDTIFDHCDGLTGNAMKECLFDVIDISDNIDYDEAKDLIFGDIDNRNGWVECVYTGRKANIDRPDTSGFNTEHTWPQSQGAGSEPERGDIHHLFPTDSDANSRRSNHPFGDVVYVDWQEGGSKLGDDQYGSTVFEPRDIQKGDTARAILYFSVRYHMSVSAHQEAAIRAWNSFDPPDDLERQRNDDIEYYQGNRNPFVDRPDFVDDISDF